MNGENIKEIRELKGISRKQLADKVGITESAIFRYETNQREPRFSILCKISEALEVPVDKIINPIYGKKSIDDLIEAGEVGKHIAEIKNKEEQEYCKEISTKSRLAGERTIIRLRCFT